MKKWLLPIVVIALLACAGAFFLFRRIGGSRIEAAADKITIANVGQYSILNLIARDKGYFSEYGVEATIDEYDSGATSVAALLSGKADFAVAADFVAVTNIFTNKDLRILAVVSTQDVFRVVARRDKGIATPADLKGKTIGVTRKTAGEYYLGRFLTLNGLSLADVTVVDRSPASMAAQLEAGQIDALLFFEPHAYDIQEKMGNAVIVWPAQGGQMATALALSTDSFVSRHPDVIERYLRGLDKAARYVQEHEDDARSLTASITRADDAYMRYSWPKFVFTLSLGQELLLTMEEQARWLIANGLTDRTGVPNYLEYISFGLLEKVVPEAVTITH